MPEFSPFVSFYVFVLVPVEQKIMRNVEKVRHTTTPTMVDYRAARVQASRKIVEKSYKFNLHIFLRTSLQELAVSRSLHHPPLAIL